MDKQLYNILVVEDNPGDYLLIEDHLLEQFENPVITQVTDFRKAADFFLSAKPPLDVILLDLTLPDKSGEQLVNEMMKIAAPIPIIILTGFSNIDFSKKSISLGISDYLVKDELNATILYKSILYAIERSKNLAALQESEKRYSNLFNLSPQPMFLYDLETLKLVQVNKAAIDHYGYSEAEFKRMTIMDIRPDSEKNKTAIAIERRRQGNDLIYTGQFKHKKKSGELIIVEIYSTAILINQRYCRSVIAIDVTERIEFDHKVTKAIIKTQEEERYEIGSELHDNVCQILATSLMSLGSVKKNMASGGLSQFEAIEEYIHMATDEIRNLSHRLAPAFFNNTSFEEAIEALIKNLDLNNQFAVDFLYSNNLNKISLNTDLQLNLYRILQEGLRNAVKYSNAKNLAIILRRENKNLSMQIADDGLGFDVNKVKSGIGVANMKRRAELFGGTFRLTSSPEQGCSIIVQIPIEQKE
ncbi:MAG: PAS domain S-box protein [Bacteroidota bacterium]|nr:PAS domain S-box protein [Bacteroidota bacterium]